MTGIFVLTLAACGVESIAFVEGPLSDEITQPNPPSVAVITFLHNDSEANQSDDFLGYELYYKLYQDNATNDPYVSDQNSILAEPVATGTGRLTNRGYRRVIRGNQEEGIPTILVTNKGLGYAIELDFFESAANPTDDDATASWNDGAAAIIDLRRNTPAVTPGTYKSFFGSFVEADQDVDSGIAAAASSDELGLALYALGYGIEGGSFRQLFSEPVFLGYLTLSQL